MGSDGLLGVVSNLLGRAHERLNLLNRGPQDLPSHLGVCFKTASIECYLMFDDSTYQPELALILDAVQ